MRSTAKYSMYGHGEQYSWPPPPRRGGSRGPPPPPPLRGGMVPPRPRLHTRPPPRPAACVRPLSPRRCASLIPVRADLAPNLYLWHASPCRHAPFTELARGLECALEGERSSPKGGGWGSSGPHPTPRGGGACSPLRLSWPDALGPLAPGRPTSVGFEPKRERGTSAGRAGGFGLLVPYTSSGAHEHT